MKRLIVAVVIAAAASVYSLATFAIDGGVVPPECALASTKAKHPGWYAPGGYCGTPSPGATTGYTSSAL